MNVWLYLLCGSPFIVASLWFLGACRLAAESDAKSASMQDLKD